MVNKESLREMMDANSKVYRTEGGAKYARQCREIRECIDMGEYWKAGRLAESFKWCSTSSMPPELREAVLDCKRATEKALDDINDYDIIRGRRGEYDNDKW